VTNEFLPNGLLKKTYGSRTYPVAYSYDYAGRLKTMTNWSGFASGAGARVTTWNYNPYRGWLDSKTYDDNTTGPAYTYTAAGRLHTRLWARGITTTYSYDNAGRLATVGYDGETTPGLGYTYDRRGRPATVTQNGMTNTLAYNNANQLLSESCDGGLLSSLSVVSSYDDYLRRATLTLNFQSSTLNSLAYGYDDASRLETVTDNTSATPYSATYTYLANSPLVSQIIFKQSTTTRMTTTKQYDFLNRLTAIGTTNAQLSTINSYNYQLNAANQRIRNVLADGSYWRYEYDSLGQVRSGRKYWPDQTPVAGQQFEYAFDDIGNRTSTKAGGDERGAGLRLANYYANCLNQYTNRDVPGTVDIMGLGFATNIVTVNGQTAYRKGEYFWKEVPVSNGSVPVWQSITVAATNQSSVSGNQFVPKTQEQFYYDADGNLTNDGRWTYAWDAENRLVSLVSRTNIGPQQLVKFEYHSKGRRIHKQVWPNTSGTGNPTNDVKFIYDGWNLMAILDSQSSMLQSFVWGSDLSGTMQGAAGVGGLLFICDLPSAIGSCAPAYDGNGNVTALVSMSGGTNCATYEYGPFGEVIRATGPLAKANPFRFSTKYQDDETDLLYYGYRYYSASAGRWLSRDPIKEQGFTKAARNSTIHRNEVKGEKPPLYLFVANSPVNQMDFLGLSCKDPCKWAINHSEAETAVTVCCGGNKYPCLIYSGGSTGATDPTAKEIIDACVMAHEQVHVNDPNYLCPKQCLWKHPTYGKWANPDPQTHRAGECAAYTVERACLEGAKNQCRGDAVCEAQIDAEIAHTQQGIDTYCN